MKLSRRRFLGTAGASAAALQMGVLDFASSLFAQAPRPAGKPRVRAVFMHPKVDRYWMGWPGAAYDIKARKADYSKVLTEAAKKEGVELELTPEPISGKADVDALIEQCKKSPPDGVIVTVQSLNSGWGDANYFCDTRGEIPTIVFSPMGTSFTGHLQHTRSAQKCFVGATQDYGWLAEAMHMLRTIWDMKQSRLCIVRGSAEEDKPLDVIGTTLRSVPRNRWLEEYNKAEATDEVRAIADYYTKEAKKIVEPSAEDILNAAKTYVVARKIMADENCQGISVDCLPLVGGKQVPCGPCLAWSKLNDELSVGACEADWNAAISLRLTGLLCGRPGFMQDPAPNTVNNTLMGAHCTCPSKLRGPDEPHEPFLLRTHSEPDKGCATQVLWPVGEEVTVMKFSGPGGVLLGTGRVAANIDTPPSGGCRTSVELEMDDVADTRDCKGFHQLFILGKFDRQFRAYCQLAGIGVTPI
jgi:hypothetical protein